MTNQQRDELFKKTILPLAWAGLSLGEKRSALGIAFLGEYNQEDAVKLFHDEVMFHTFVKQLDYIIKDLLAGKTSVDALRKQVDNA